MSLPSPLLEVEGLRVTYRRRRDTITAVDDVSFDLHRGETLGLVGESGSGKSTIARAILGLAAVEAGRIRFMGEEVTRLSFKERRRFYGDVQLVFQDPYSSLNPMRSIGSILAEPLLAQGQRDRRAIGERVAAVLNAVHLPADASSRYPAQFSGGQRQRVAIARALIASPKLLICDEAVSSLDLSVQAQILNLLRELQVERGVTYLFISHDLEVVRHMCRRVIVLYRGRVMEMGSARSLWSEPAHPYSLALHDAVPVLDPHWQRQRHRPFAVSVADALTSVEQRSACVFAARCPYAVERCRTERPALRPSREGLVACHRWPEWRSDVAVEDGIAPGLDALQRAMSADDRPQRKAASGD